MSDTNGAGAPAKGPRIVMMGAGALGGYVGAHLALAGHDVTLVDFWHDHIETIRKNGVQLSGLTPEETFSVPVKTMHLHEVSSMAKQGLIDIAFVSMKSYDTDWITTLVKPYLSPTGYVVSLQNCINEETIAGIVGWGKTIGCIASAISVELYEPGKIRRQAPKASGDTSIFRVGEVHGRLTRRIEDLATMLRHVDGTKATTNLWGERWSKLSQNAMRNGLSAATGLSGREMDEIEPIRHFSMRLAGEAVEIGIALGYELEKIGKLDPQELLKALHGDKEAFAKSRRPHAGADDGGRARRVPAAVDGSGYDQGPPYRNRLPQRFHCPQGQGDRHRGACQRTANRGSAARRTRRDSGGDGEHHGDLAPELSLPRAAAA